MAGAAALAAALTVTVASATADDGNAQNAKVCQKGGWMNLQGSDGTQFASEQECVGFGAHGGTIVPKPTFKQQWQTICENGGGRFETSLDGTQWGCFPTTAGGLSQATFDALATPCTAAGGHPGSSPPPPGPFVTITCYRVPV